MTIEIADQSSVVVISRLFVLLLIYRKDGSNNYVKIIIFYTAIFVKVNYAEIVVIVIGIANLTNYLMYGI